jgi:predicted dithiol-disulfide oxidoreductase (DUF899 family)/uncharacterized protein YndB with AHSA1/START domain
MTDTTTTTSAGIVNRREPGSPEIDLEITIDAPIDAVFDFLVVPEKLFRWMGVDGEIDPTTGGVFRVNYATGDVASGEYTDVSRPERVAMTWGWDGSDELPPGSSDVIFDLRRAAREGEPTRTIVRVTHSGLPNVALGDKHVEGWTYFLPQLAHQAARDRLRAAELELMLQRERVAAMRRELPLGPSGSDYEFDEVVDGETRRVALRDLFTSPERPLVVYHFMYGKKQMTACPMCSMWMDGWNAVADHLAENVDFVVAASADAADWAALASDRGWDNVRLVSAALSTFKLDIGGEDAEGFQEPAISVWELVDGEPRLTYSGGAHIDGDHWRGIDLLSPVWHMLDLTRAGRGDWMPGV